MGVGSGVKGPLLLGFMVRSNYEQGRPKENRELDFRNVPMAKDLQGKEKAAHLAVWGETQPILLKASHSLLELHFTPRLPDFPIQCSFC